MRRLQMVEWVGPSISFGVESPSMLSITRGVRDRASIPSPSNRAKARDSSTIAPTLTKYRNEQAWVNFRIGAKPFIPFENTQFPVDSAEQYFAQMVPNTETSYAEAGQATVDALAKLLDRVGPAVLVVHSQSGAYGIAAAVARPALVKA